MNGATNIEHLLKHMKPHLNAGEYVFCTPADLLAVPADDIVMMFREAEATTVIVPKAVADALSLHYTYVAAWITLTVHSALEAVGLTAAFSAALARHQISCNVVAAYYHDHIFVAQHDAERAMIVLNELSA